MSGHQASARPPRVAEGLDMTWPVTAGRPVRDESSLLGLTMYRDPRSPAPEVDAEYYRPAATSSTISATKASSGRVPTIPRPRARTATTPSFASRSPTTTM